ncbi:DMT family transporter [Vibrio viridaestus]|uniref:EamA family transporter n=1 Tax=Vibrio viridaestus TaxID=2487322 RepID=A0A3N9TDE3_9VIBR|nr:EamA family transporter [Vibrio viridaestus]RQW62217.1 EamA family transporter [Vibrio viridaestus]
MTKSNESFYGTLAVILASVFWGTTGVAASFAPNVNSLAIGAVAMGFGGLLLVLCSIKSLLQDRILLTQNIKWIIIGGLSVAIYPLAFYTAMKWSGVAIGNIISIASAPLYSAIFERLFSKRSVSLKWWVCFAFGLTGVTFLSLGKVSSISYTSTPSYHYFGMLLGALAGLTYALYAWIGKSLIDKGIRSKSSMASMFGCAALILLPTLIFTGEGLFDSVTNIAAISYIAVIPMFCGYLLFGYGLNRIAASQATMITLLEPVIATLLAIQVIGEQFVMIGWIGMALVMICLILQVSPTRRLEKIPI